MSKTDPYGDPTTVGPAPLGAEGPGATAAWDRQEPYPGEPHDPYSADPVYGIYSAPNSDAVTEALPAGRRPGDGYTHLGPPPRAEVSNGLFDTYSEYDASAAPLSARSPMVVIGAGGLVAALAVVGVVVFWPSGDGIGTASGRVDTTALAPVPSEGAPVAQLPLTPDPTAEDADPTTRSAPTTKRTIVPLPATTIPAPPVVVPPPDTPPPPVTTTTTPPPVTTTTPVTPPPGGGDPPGEKPLP